MSEEFIFNWTNSLRQTNDGEIYMAARTAAKLKDDGYTVDEVADLMVAENYSDKTISKAVKMAFKQTDEEPQEEVKVASAYVVPTSYEDVKPFVENALRKYSAREFMSRLARSEYPIIPNLRNNKFETFCRLAEAAQQDAYALNILHDDLAPFVEEAMYQAVVTAEKKKERVSISQSDASRYVVASSMQNVHDVSTENGSCNCAKYVQGNYADFGLACEHLVAVADKISPNEKLVRGSE